MMLDVIVPVYNGRKYLFETVTSIINSTYRDIEIILVNDGSSDDSLYICNELSERYRNIKVINQNNGGIVSARNKGLENAEGDFVAFCDQDDVVEPRMYELLIKHCQNKNLDIAFCGVNRYVQGRKIPCESFDDNEYKTTDVYSELLLPVLFYGSDIVSKNPKRYVGTIWKCVFRKSMISDIRFRKYLQYEDDFLFFVNALTRASRVGTLAYHGYNWRINLLSETYNKRYIDNIENKYVHYIDDVVGMTGKILDLYGLRETYIDYLKCKFYEKFIINECNFDSKKSLLDKVMTISQKAISLQPAKFHAIPTLRPIIFTSVFLPCAMISSAHESPRRL